MDGLWNVKAMEMLPNTCRIRDREDQHRPLKVMGQSRVGKTVQNQPLLVKGIRRDEKN